MAIFSGAVQRHIPVNFDEGGNHPRLMVIHIMEGTLAGTDSWFRNPAAKVSAHFGVGKDGTIYQWVDTANEAWHAEDANAYSIGVENEGDAGQTLTTAQLEANAKIYAWAHHVHGIPMWLNRHPFVGEGLAYHAEGGVSWGDHPDCPGAPIIAQRQSILNKAQVMLNPPTWFALAEQDLVSAGKRITDTPPDLVKAGNDIADALARLKSNAK